MTVGQRVFVRHEAEAGESTWWAGAVKAIEVDRVSVALAGDNSDSEI